MRRSAFLPFLLAAFIALGGCASVTSQRLPDVVTSGKEQTAALVALSDKVVQRSHALSALLLSSLPQRSKETFQTEEKALDTQVELWQANADTMRALGVYFKRLGAFADGKPTQEAAASASSIYSNLDALLSLSGSPAFGDRFSELATAVANAHQEGKIGAHLMNAAVPVSHALQHEIDFLKAQRANMRAFETARGNYWLHQVEVPYFENKPLGAAWQTLWANRAKRFNPLDADFEDAISNTQDLLDAWQKLVTGQGVTDAEVATLLQSLRESAEKLAKPASGASAAP